MASLKGRLLVATPMLTDPNFDRTVVWLLEHGDDGSLGLVLNRPSELPLADPLPSWRDHGGELPVVFLGGPVSTTSVIGLARLAGDVPPGTWESVQGRTGVLDLTSDPALVADALVDLRCFAGYAGWGAGQLEDEIGGGAWFVVDVEPDDPFSHAPDGLWRAVLARQGAELARFALVPDDPSVN